MTEQSSGSAVPRKVLDDNLDAFDYSDFATLLAAMIEFRDANEGLEIKSEIENCCGDFGPPAVKFQAFRMETQEEADVRAGRESRERAWELARHQAAKRADYERLKREFGE